VFAGHGVADQLSAIFFASSAKVLGGRLIWTMHTCGFPEAVFDQGDAGHEAGDTKCLEHEELRCALA
jgi:hypothetical protein